MRTALTSILLAALWGLGACATPAYDALRSEREIPGLAALLEQRPSLRRVMVTTRGEAGAELDVAVHEEEGESSRVIVMIHGVLADSRAWRYVSGPLSDDADVMLVDLPGNGDSENPPPFILKREDPAGYSTRAMAYRAAEAIEARLSARARPAESVAVVAHSLGSLVALRMLADESIAPCSRRWMRKVDRLVLISPIDAAMPYGPPSLEAVANASWLTVEIGEKTGMLRERIAKGARRSFVDPDRMPREQVDALIATIADAHRRAVAQDVLKHVFPTVIIDGVYYPDWSRTERILEAQERLGDRDQMACLLMVGERDEVAPIAMAYRMATQLADARIVTIARTKHSPHVERATIAAHIIDEFIERGTVPDIGEAERHGIRERHVEP